MGTIADKLLYLDDTKTKLRNAINLRGGTIAGADTFRSYVSQLQQLIWLPDALFANGEQGLWYDPSDLTTLFQDSAGTTPVTATGQPVGLILDKSKGLAKGDELVVNGAGEDVTGWIAQGGATSITSVSSEFEAATGSSGGYFRSFATVVGKTYYVEGRLRVGTASNARLVITRGSTAAGALVAGTNSITSGTMQNATFVFTALDTTSTVYLRNEGAGTAYYDNISVRELPGNHATQATVAARPTYRNVGGLHYLEFDGVDDFLVTSTIDFSTTNKITSALGVTKKRNADREMIYELSITAASPGTFNMDHSQSVSGAYAATLATPNAAGALCPANTAPSTDVLSVQYDSSQTGISNEAIFSQNGVVQTTTQLGNPDSGSGNLGIYPIYIGRRGGTSLPFQGDIYSLIIRGAATSAGSLTSAHQYVGTKTGVVIP